MSADQAKTGKYYYKSVYIIKLLESKLIVVGATGKSLLHRLELWIQKLKGTRGTF